MIWCVLYHHAAIHLLAICLYARSIRVALIRMVIYVCCAQVLEHFFRLIQFNVRYNIKINLTSVTETVNLQKNLNFRSLLFIRS